MGMTIDDAKCCLEDGYDVCSASCKYFSTGGPNCKDNVVKFAIDIMNKYQKIKEQVDIAIDKENFAISDARLIQIREIINENDD